MEHAKKSFSKSLVLDELLDLTLYTELRKTSQGNLKKILGELIPVEQGHLDFWRNFFGVKTDRLNWRRRAKLWVLLWACRLLGAPAVHLVLEGIEVYGVRKYLAIWESYKGTPLGEAVKEILKDEFGHEDAIVSQMTERKIDPERIRSIFLGFNDGLVEILGAVSGFFAAFHHASTVLIAGSTVAVAGAISMAAGAYVASSSEKEVEEIEEGKARFLNATGAAPAAKDRILGSAVLVGVCYLVGATVPVLPVLIGAQSVFASLLSAGVMIVLVSFVLSFLSGMDVWKRIATNLVIIAAAVGITYFIGALTRAFWGIDL
ncbi:MAG: VIT1/CCC1 transporter family protein [Elusimicrobia bacterium]|nr:VIT1/CCC1 transporter family protein [Elusimicrobiota bacterium]